MTRILMTDRRVAWKDRTVENETRRGMGAVAASSLRAVHQDKRYGRARPSSGSLLD